MMMGGLVLHWVAFYWWAPLETAGTLLQAAALACQGVEAFFHARPCERCAAQLSRHGEALAEAWKLQLRWFHWARDNFRRLLLAVGGVVVASVVIGLTGVGGESPLGMTVLVLPVCLLVLAAEAHGSVGEWCPECRREGSTGAAWPGPVPGT